MRRGGLQVSRLSEAGVTDDPSAEPLPPDLIEADRLGAALGAVLSGTCRRCFGALLFDPARPAEPLCSCMEAPAAGCARCELPIGTGPVCRSCGDIRPHHRPPCDPCGGPDHPD